MPEISFNHNWYHFINSNFKYRPPRTFFNGKAYWKTNAASWAAQD